MPLGGNGDSRASGLASGVWCLLVGTVTAGQADSRASGLASGVWCLLEGTVTAGQAELRSASEWSLAKRTTGTASSHLGMSTQEQAAGRGQVETSLGEMLLRQRQVDD